MSDQEEVQRLRAALEKIQERARRSSESWHPGQTFPSASAKMWHDGFVTCLAEMSLLAFEALDPDGWQEHREFMTLGSHATDREWFEKTGCCGHCGNPGGDCVCTDDDPCGCGPHEPRTWPVPCYACKGTGQQDPLREKGLTLEVAPGQDSLL